MSIDPRRVTELYGECLAEELVPGDPNHVVVEGIVHNSAFDVRKLDGHRHEVAGMLAQLPMAFRPASVGGGGGWSFLNACQDAEGKLWTGMHWTVEQLISLGMALDQVSWCLPRESWEMLPGGMPYFLVVLPEDVEAHEQYVAELAKPLSPDQIRALMREE
jgi:hypothetical protein